MPSWKKIIVSGSDASLNSLQITNLPNTVTSNVVYIDGTGNLSYGATGTVTSASYAETASYVNTASYALNAMSASYATTASYAVNGGVTQLFAGPNITLAPTTGVGQVTISSAGAGTYYNTSTGSYGSFYDTTTQTNPVANVPRSMSLNTTDTTNGVSVSGSLSPFNTYIKVTNAGVYNIQFSAQLIKTDSGTDYVDIWLRRNGVDLLDSATNVTLIGNNDRQVAAWNWFTTAGAGDYYQIMWASADTDTQLLAESATGVHPGIPSVIVTANRIDTFLSNTGSFSGSFNGVLNGTASYATQAATASFVQLAQTASYVANAQTASFVTTAQTASYVLNAVSSSYASTASYIDTLNQNVIVSGSLTITDNLTVFGSSSITYVTSSQLNIATNIISVNTINPGARFGGLTVIDSGSSPQTSGSLLFDSVNNHWIFVHQSEAGAQATSSILIMGPQSFDNIGNETTLTANRLVKSTFGDLGEHISNSNITDNGTIVSINSNTEITGSLRVTSNITGSGLLITGSTSGNLVRITQTGAGPAFVVEDSTNPDASNFIIDTSGSVGIGSPLTPSIFSSKLYIGFPDISGYAGIKSNGNNNHAIIGYGSSGYAGIYGENNETSGNNNIGVYGKAYQDGDPFNGVLMIGGKFEAAGDPQYAINYSVQLKDGTEGAGKVLVSQDASGSANWSTQLSGSYGLTGSLTVTDKIKGTSSHIDTNALIQASLLYLSNNF